MKILLIALAFASCALFAKTCAEDKKIFPNNTTAWVIALMHGLETYVLAVPVFYLIFYNGYGSIHGGILLVHVVATAVLLIVSIVMFFWQRDSSITGFVVGLIGIVALGDFLLPIAMNSPHPHY